MIKVYSSGELMASLNLNCLKIKYSLQRQEGKQCKVEQSPKECVSSGQRLLGSSLTTLGLWPYLLKCVICTFKKNLTL